MSQQLGRKTIQALQSTLISALFRFLSILPLRVQQALGSVTGTLLYIFPSESRRVTLTNLRLCFPEKSESELRDICRESLRETGKTACELGLIWAAPIDRVLKHVVRVEGEELLEQALADGKGLIIITPHLGSWELSGLYVSTRVPITYLYRPPKIRALEKVMTGFRGRGAANPVPTTPRGILQMMKALKAGEVAGILPDQQPGYDSGVFAPFFTEQALTMTLVGKLSSKTGAPVISVVSRRLPWGQGFVIEFRPTAEGIGSEDPQLAATALNQSVESLVRNLVTQYQWEYKRFKRRPPGDTRKIYRKTV